MTKDTNNPWTSLPVGFPACSLSQCSRCERCLHYLYYQSIESTDSPSTFYHPSKPSVGDRCKEYVEARAIPYKYGFVKGLSLIPYGKIREVQEGIQRQARVSRSVFYRLRGGKQVITEEQERVITKIFGEYGISSNQVYDREELHYPTM